MMRKLRKGMAFMLLSLLILTAGTIPARAAWNGTVATRYASGAGTATSPYVIQNETQLAYFAAQLEAGVTYEGQYLSLSKDLDMTGGTWSVAMGTTFAGTFRGNGHSITLNSRFLGTIAEGGTVDWLNLRATQTLSDALLCRYNAGTIQNCRVRGDVILSTGDAALLCYENQSTGTVINSCGFGALEGHGDDADCHVGWIAKSSGTIRSCYSVMTLTASASGRYNDAYTGGITASGSYENCYTGDAVLANDTGFIELLNQSMNLPGYVWAADSSKVNEGYPVIQSCLTAVTQLAASADPMFSYHSSSLTTTITCSESGHTIYYTLDGSDPRTSSTRKTYSSSLTISGDTVVKSVAYKGGKYGAPNTQYAIRQIGSGTASDPYQIATRLGLYAIRFAPESVYRLTVDLDFTGSNYVHNGIVTDSWVSIPSFSGTLLGGRHSITGLHSTTGGFVDSNSGTIQELRLLKHQLCRRGIDFHDYYDHFGPVANSNYGTITRCYAAADPNATDRTMVMDNYVGGIVGDNDGTISYCNSSGEIRVSAYEHYSCPYMGGIAGCNGGTIQSCYSDAHIYTCYTSNDLGATAGGITCSTGSGYVYDCRFDGVCVIDSYMVSYGLGVAINLSRFVADSYRCYDGGAIFTIPVGTSSRFYPTAEHDKYKTTNSGADRMELSFPKLDFDTVWMITESGPMPQGVMNADGNYYTKVSYTAPGMDTPGETVCKVNGTSVEKTFPLSAAGMVMGTHGDNLTWKLLADGSLIISGTGEMSGDDIWDFPWYWDRETDTIIASTITSITIESGVTSVAPYAFYKSGATSISLPETVTSIGNYAFDRSGLTAVTLPASLKTIGTGVFYGLDGMEVTFLGDAPAFSVKTFDSCSATAYYPPDNTTWTTDVLQDYGGSVTWHKIGECLHKEEWHTLQNAAAATCTDPGYTGDTVCTECGETLQKGSSISALGHDEQKHDAKAPSCTEIGWDAYVTCSRCEYSTYSELSATGDHVYDGDNCCIHCGGKSESVRYDAAARTITLKDVPDGTKSILIAVYRNGRMIGITAGKLGENQLTSTAQADMIQVFYLGSDYQPAAKPHRIVLS